MLRGRAVDEGVKTGQTNVEMHEMAILHEDFVLSIATNVTGTKAMSILVLLARDCIP
jgi:hypothetical protein